MLEHAPTIFDVLKGSVPISIQALFVCLFLVLLAVVLVLHGRGLGLYVYEYK